MLIRPFFRKYINLYFLKKANIAFKIPGGFTMTKTMRFATLVVVLFALFFSASSVLAQDQYGWTRPAGTANNVYYGGNNGGRNAYDYATGGVNTATNAVVAVMATINQNRQAQQQQETMRQQTEASKQTSLAQTAAYNGVCGYTTAGRNNASRVEVTKNPDSSPCLTLTPYEREQMSRNQGELARIRAESEARVAEINAQSRARVAEITAQNVAQYGNVYGVCPKSGCRQE